MHVPLEVTEIIGLPGAVVDKQHFVNWAMPVLETEH